MHTKRAQYPGYILRMNRNYNGNWWERAADDIRDGIADVDPGIFDALVQKGSCHCDEDEAEVFLQWAESVPEYIDEVGEEALEVDLGAPEPYER